MDDAMNEQPQNQSENRTQPESEGEPSVSRRAGAAGSPRLGVFGRGRLGSAIIEAAGARVAWSVGRDEDPGASADIVIDASLPPAVEIHLDWALETRTDLVIAVTGWSRADLEARVGGRIGVLVAPNGSLLVALQARMTAMLAAFASATGSGCGYVIEHHHDAKRDAPSGTANRLIDAWRLGAGATPAVASLRAGSEIGSHTVGLDAPHEILEIHHRARSRAVFAHGLVAAADWLQGRTGLYTMEDVAAGLLPSYLMGDES